MTCLMAPWGPRAHPDDGPATGDPSAPADPTPAPADPTPAPAEAAPAEAMPGATATHAAASTPAATFPGRMRRVPIDGLPPATPAESLPRTLPHAPARRAASKATGDEARVSSQ